MKILSIETSCDETAVSLVEAHGDFPDAKYKILGNAIFSQIDIHRKFGGVFPAVAKREHIKILVPMFQKALEGSGELEESAEEIPREIQEKLYEILNRESYLADKLIEFAEHHKSPTIDLIAVTSGPGLEPALWVGINFAKALSYLLNTPVVAVNHMEGHVLSSIFNGKTIANIKFPALALLISGGHTELVEMKDWITYKLVGQTRDDAVGEAFDKVARMIGLPYPGGPEISKFASEARKKHLPQFTKLPKPMLDSGDYDFSFSGLKTAVKYAINDKKLSDNEKKSLARDFEDTVTTVLLKKTLSAIEEHGTQTLIIGGGVSANIYIRSIFTEYFEKEYPEIKIYFPNTKLSTDNSIMIALAGHARVHNSLSPTTSQKIKADGNRSLNEE